jgi:hypothetical protein
VSRVLCRRNVGNVVSLCRRPERLGREDTDRRTLITVVTRTKDDLEAPRSTHQITSTTLIPSSMSKKKKRNKKDQQYDQIVDRTSWHPYQHACGYESQIKIETIESKFRLNLDSQMTFWVKSEPNKDDGPADDIPAYELTFRHDTPVLDILTAVKEQEGFQESDDLYLIYCDVTLNEGKTLASYRDMIAKEKQQWAFPYAGVLWVAAEGHVPPKDKMSKVPQYYSNESVSRNIFHRRNSMKQ